MRTMDGLLEFYEGSDVIHVVGHVNRVRLEPRRGVWDLVFLQNLPWRDLVSYEIFDDHVVFRVRDVWDGDHDVRVEFMLVLEQLGEDEFRYVMEYCLLNFGVLFLEGYSEVLKLRAHQLDNAVKIRRDVAKRLGIVRNTVVHLEEECRRVDGFLLLIQEVLR